MYSGTSRPKAHRTQVRRGLFTLRNFSIALSVSLFLIFTLGVNLKGSQVPVAGQNILTQPDKNLRSSLREKYAKLPLSFEVNQGQSDERVRFLSRGPHSSLFLTEVEAVVAFRSSKKDPKGTVLRLRWVGANPKPQMSGMKPLPGKSHYLIGNASQNWHRDIPQFAKVKYDEVYPGIDMVYYGNGRQLEYDFIVSPGVNPEVITLAFAGIRSSGEKPALWVDEKGDLILNTSGGEVRQHKPIVFQEQNGSRVVIPSSYVLKGGEQVGFQVAAYDKSQPLLIDPILSYSTFLGGTSFDDGKDIAVDSEGNVYVLGETSSVDFPAAPNPCVLDPRTCPAQGFKAGSTDLFVTKLNSTGTQLIFSTYLGGSAPELPHNLTVDSEGNAYVVGATFSADFPVHPTICTLDPRTCPLQGSKRGTIDGFLTKLNPEGSGFVFSTYLGGEENAGGNEGATGVALDDAGNIYVAGFTTAPNFPTTVGAYDRICGTDFNCNYVPERPDPTDPTIILPADAPNDVFATVINPEGTTLLYSTFLGGTDGDTLIGMAVDAEGDIYLTGNTSSNDFRLKNPIQSYQGGVDAFVTKLSPQGLGDDDLIYSTYLGGQGSRDMGWEITVDSEGHAYVAGVTDSTEETGFPATVGPDLTHNGGFDVFVAKLSLDGSELHYAGFLGGANFDIAKSIKVDPEGNAYLVGLTNSPDFPAVEALQEYKLGNDAFVTKVNSDGTQILFSTFLGGSDSEEARGIALDEEGSIYVTGTSQSADFPTTEGAWDRTLDDGEAFVVKIAQPEEFPEDGFDPDNVVVDSDSSEDFSGGCSLGAPSAGTHSNFWFLLGAVLFPLILRAWAKHR